MAALVLPRVNTDMMSLFLEHVAQVFPAYFVLVQVDQASYHTSQFDERYSRKYSVNSPAAS